MEKGGVSVFSHLFQNFPQFIVIHTVKGFGIVNKAEIDASERRGILWMWRGPSGLRWVWRNVDTESLPCDLLPGDSSFSMFLWTNM